LEQLLAICAKGPCSCNLRIPMSEFVKSSNLKTLNKVAVMS
jgi:hypothetical protein